MKHTKKGQKYAARLPILDRDSGPWHGGSRNITNRNFISLLDDNAFNQVNPRVFDNLDVLEEKFGLGTRLYFTFSKLVIICNALIAICGITSWMFFLFDKNKTWSFTIMDVFVSNYTASMRPIWYWSNCAVFILWGLVGPAYFIYEQIAYRNQKRQADENYWDYEDMIEENTLKSTQYIRSILLFVLSVGVVGGALYGLLYAQNYVSIKYPSQVILHSGITTSTVMSIPVTIVFVVSNLIWNSLSYVLTTYENNQRWSHFRISQSLKLIMFKIITTTVLYTLMAIVLSQSKETCLMQSSGTNFFFIVLFDAISTLFLAEIIAPLLNRWIRSRCLAWGCSCCNNSNTEPEFTISQELLQTMYRQFIVCIGFIVFPLIGSFAFIISLLQYPVDKIKLIYVCKDPQYIQEFLGPFLLIYSAVIATAVLLTFPNGILWMQFVPSILPMGYQNCTMTV